MPTITKVAVAAVIALYVLGFVLAVAIWGEAGAGGMLVAYTVENIANHIVKWHKSQITKGY